MNTFSKTKRILGGIPGLFDETNFERETSLASTVTQAASAVFEATLSLGEDIKGEKTGNFPTTGSIEFKKSQAPDEARQKEKAAAQRIFFQALKEDRQRAKEAKDKLLEVELDDIMINLPTEQKNEMLHYQLSYKDKSIYQMAELRKKLIEQKKKSEAKEKAATVPSPAKQPNSLEVAFEGASGSKGNLSFQAVG